MSFLKLIIPVCIACTCNTFANALWKLEFNNKPFVIRNIQDVLNLVFSIKILIGIFFYMASMFLFFYLLSNFKLSVVVPLTSMTYLFNIISAYFLLKEKISIQQLIGTAIIVIGIFIVSQAPIGTIKNN